MEENDYVVLKVDMVLNGTRYRAKIVIDNPLLLTKDNVEGTGRGFISSVTRTMIKSGFLPPVYSETGELIQGTDALFYQIGKEKQDAENNKGTSIR